MMNLIVRRVKPKDLPIDLELKMMEGSLEKLRVVLMEAGDRLLCRGSEAFVPQGEREAMLNTLHLTHSAPDSMLAIECIGQKCKHKST